MTGVPEYWRAVACLVDDLVPLLGKFELANDSRSLHFLLSKISSANIRAKLYGNYEDKDKLQSLGILIFGGRTWKDDRGDVLSIGGLFALHTRVSSLHPTARSLLRGGNAR